jgi:hypothetical protein
MPKENIIRNIEIILVIIIVVIYCGQQHHNGPSHTAKRQREPNGYSAGRPPNDVRHAKTNARARASNRSKHIFAITAKIITKFK